MSDKIQSFINSIKKLFVENTREEKSEPVLNKKSDERYYIVFNGNGVPLCAKTFELWIDQSSSFCDPEIFSDEEIEELKKREWQYPPTSKKQILQIRGYEIRYLNDSEESL